MSGKRVFRSSAPVRLDFAGGWTDVAPFAEREHGVVVNAAIELRAEVEVEPAAGGFHLESEDLQDVLRLSGPEELVADGRLDLLKAALRRYPIPGGTLRTRCAAPAPRAAASSSPSAGTRRSTRSPSD